MQFQWRQAAAGAEKFHSAMLPHGGEHTRIYQQTVALGAELASLRNIVGSTQQAPVAILFDWDSWWALEQQATPAQLSYVQIVLRWYRELRRRGVLVDFARPGSNLGAYQAVIAPATVVLSAQAADGLARYARDGGVLVVGYQTGILNEHLHAWLDGYLGGPALRDALGVHVEEFAPPAEPSLSGGSVPRLHLAFLGAGGAEEWGEVLRADQADVRATFVGGMLDGVPAITRNGTGTGSAWYVGTAPEDLGTVVEAILADASIAWTLLPDDVEIVERGSFRFTLNFGAELALVDGVAVPAPDALIQRNGHDLAAAHAGTAASGVSG